MRFKLEKEDASGKDCNSANHYITTAKVRVNSETTVSLPTISYVIVDKPTDQPTDQHFTVFDSRCNTRKVLTSLHQGLQLKLEKVGNDNKLALVTNSGEYYYYYRDGNVINIATIDLIPKSSTNGTHVSVYDTHPIKFKPLESSKVLIDLKDIISSRNINLILQDLGNSPDKRLEIRTGDKFFQQSKNQLYQSYRSIEIHNSAGSKVGMLNNVVPIFDRRSNDFKIFPFHEIESLKAQDSYFATKKLGDNYVGCISYENGECKNFYPLNPNSFGDKYDHNLVLYPYYYNLENFGNFLEVDMKVGELIDLEERVGRLENEIKQMKRMPGPPGLPGLDGYPGDKGPKGDMGDKGDTGVPGTNGLKGDKGVDGLLGMPGEKGDLGLKGDRGEIGAPGIPGPQGPVGPKGADGAPGRVGLRGEKGDASSAIEIATELVISQKAKLGEAVLDAKGASGKNLATQVAGEVNISPQEFVNKVDPTKFTEEVVHKLSREEAKEIANDTVSKIISDATQQNNPDPTAFKKYENFAEKLAELLVDRSNISNTDANTLVENKVSGWGLAKYLLLHSDLKEQAKALCVVKERIDKEKLVEYLLEYARLQGDEDTAKTMVENIANQFFDTKVDELGKAVLEVKDDQGKKILVNDKALQKGVAEELRKNPGQIKGADGAPGVSGNKGDAGPKGDMGDKGDTGVPGTNGLKGDKGVDGLLGMPGEKGDLGLKGDRGEIGAPGIPGPQGLVGPKGADGLPGMPGIKGNQGDIGPKGDMGDKGDRGDVGLPGAKGDKGNEGSSGPKGLRGWKGESGLQGKEGAQGKAGKDGTPGSKGADGAPGPKGSKGEDGVGAAEADQFLRKMNQTKIEIQNAKKAAEDAKSASENFAKEAKDFKEEVVELNTEVKNMKDDTEEFADQALRSEKNAKAFYSKTKDIFCRTSPTDQVCIAHRGKREAERKKYFNDQPVTSGASRPSSWINVFANTIVGAITGAFQPVSSFKPAIGFNNSQPSKAITTQDIDINGTLSLLDVFIRKITGQKHISTADQPALSLEELECYASYITIEFEEVLKYAAVKSGISVKNLNFNPVSVQSAIFQHINNGQYSKIPKSLYSFAKGACPDYKQTDKFLAIFKDHMERALGSNEQLSNTKEIVTSSEQPRSFMNNVTSPTSHSAINQTAVGYLR